MSCMTILFLNLQFTRSDIRSHIKLAVSLVIEYDHFNLPHSVCVGHVWVNILTTKRNLHRLLVVMQFYFTTQKISALLTAQISTNTQRQPHSLVCVCVCAHVQFYFTIKQKKSRNTESLPHILFVWHYISTYDTNLEATL